jgi:hypothetical protein
MEVKERAACLSARVVQDGDGQWLEQDISEILRQAEQKTKALNKKFAVAKKEGLSSSLWTFGADRAATRARVARGRV